MSSDLQPLGPAGAPQGAEDFIDGLGLWDDPGRDGLPRVVAVMIGSADGRAAVQGRAGGLGSVADRAVLRGMRVPADALLVGSATLLAERYDSILDPGGPERRAGRGRPAEPLVAAVSRGLDPALGELPLLARPEARVQVYTEAEGELAGHGAQVATRGFAPGTLTLRACLEDLAANHGARVVVTEGGPTLLRVLFAEGLVDDLVLTVAPLIVAGDAPGVVEGAGFDPPLRLGLRAVLRGEDHLFLHYAVPAG